MFDVGLLVFQTRPCSLYFYGVIQTDCRYRSRADSKPSIASWRGCISHIHVQLRVVCLPEWQGSSYRQHNATRQPTTRSVPFQTLQHLIARMRSTGFHPLHTCPPAAMRPVGGLCRCCNTANQCAAGIFLLTVDIARCRDSLTLLDVSQHSSSV
jgi:hypothetical protein